ncbi:hypothetical protein CDL12_04931 [Handroanthus impetiginosus]|uniref:Uncharacterized protein n=1 Tax=Handroanthus impetiginosus TaxID=429701 RepID=A0A2G9HXW6_9LAMI|nr:hypothetical protein CDL12_04931 [Handroanthus impetiginosus]
MENSTNIPEESSWTFYIQGFMCDNNEDDGNSCFSSEFESPSLVSDATSSAVKKLMTEGGKSNCKSPGNVMSKQNSFKKQKTYKVISAMDHDLEDTASSPVNSPKVSYMNQFMNQKGKAKMDVSEVQRNIFGRGGVFAVQRDSKCTELKKGI